MFSDFCLSWFSPSRPGALSPSLGLPTDHQWVVCPVSRHHPPSQHWPFTQFLFRFQIYCCSHFNWFCGVWVLIWFNRLQMFLPPPSYEEIFPQWDVEGERKRSEREWRRRGGRKVNFPTSDKFDENFEEEILPLQEDPCRSFFSRVAKWGDAVRLEKKADHFDQNTVCKVSRWRKTWFSCKIQSQEGVVF